MDETKILSKDEAERIRAAIIPMIKLVQHLKSRKAAEYYETFAMDVILEFLGLLSDLTKTYEQLS